MKQAHSTNERGAVLVELAIVLPLLALIFLSIVDLGIVIREHQIVQNAAREGARFSSLPRNWIDPANPNATEMEIKRRVIDYLAQENIAVDAASITIDQNHPIVAGGLTLRGSEVRVTYARNLLVAGGPLLPFGLVTISGHALFRNLY